MSRGLCLNDPFGAALIDWETHLVCCLLI